MLSHFLPASWACRLPRESSGTVGIVMGGRRRSSLGQRCALALHFLLEVDPVVFVKPS